MVATSPLPLLSLTDSWLLLMMMRGTSAASTASKQPAVFAGTFAGCQGLCQARQTLLASGVCPAHTKTAHMTTAAAVTAPLRLPSHPP